MYSNSYNSYTTASLHYSILLPELGELAAVFNRYKNLKSAPRLMKNLEHWLSELTQVTSIGKLRNLPETGSFKPQEDFLISCKDLDPEYATTCPCHMQNAKNAGAIDSLPTLDDYVVELTAFLW